MTTAPRALLALNVRAESVDDARVNQPDVSPARFEGRGGYVEFVDSYPLFAASYVGTLDLDSLERYLAWCADPFFRRKTTVAYVLDLTRVEDFGSVHRKLQAEWISANEELIERYTAGVCFALSSRVQRGLLTAVFWAAKPGYPYRIVSTREEAVGWAVEQLRGAEVTVPPRCIERSLVAPY